LSFKRCLGEKRLQVDRFLQKYLESKGGVPETLYRAMEYSLFAGGKRLRPILLLSGCELCGGDPLQAMPLACAVEMIHTYSLIHDDLPAMDNDDFRRGKPTNHRVFGEGIAVLAGDGLLNSAFELMLGIRPLDGGRLEAVRVIAEAAGVSGMIGGQVLDLEYEGKEIQLEDLKKMHSKKTGELISGAILAGALAAGCSGNKLQSIRNFGQSLGLAFQIRDDILDVIGDREVLGKDTGSDSSGNKSTYVSLLGLEEAKAAVGRLAAEAKENLAGFGNRAGFLVWLTDYLVDREF
jgi:geranylgeranyl diphosphate synthase type II